MGTSVGSKQPHKENRVSNLLVTTLVSLLTGILPNFSLAYHQLTTGVLRYLFTEDAGSCGDTAGAGAKIIIEAGPLRRDRLLRLTTDLKKLSTDIRTHLRLELGCKLLNLSIVGTSGQRI